MQASVRRFWLLHKTINRGNGTERLLRCCSAARILHSERPAFACDCRSYGWVAQLAEQWTEIHVSAVRFRPQAFHSRLVLSGGHSVVNLRLTMENKAVLKL